MARKLTPAELAEATGAAFQKPVDPGQTELFGTQKVSAKKKEKQKRGRRQIHDTGRQASIWLEEHELDALRIAAAMRRVSLSEMGATYIRQGLKDDGRL